MNEPVLKVEGLTVRQLQAWANEQPRYATDADYDDSELGDRVYVASATIDCVLSASGSVTAGVRISSNFGPGANSLSAGGGDERPREAGSRIPRSEDRRCRGGGSTGCTRTHRQVRAGGSPPRAAFPGTPSGIRPETHRSQLRGQPRSWL